MLGLRTLGLRRLNPLLAMTILLVVPAKGTTSYYQGAASEAAFNTAVGGLTLLSPTLTFSTGTLVAGGLLDANGTGIDFLGFDTAFSFNAPLSFNMAGGTLTATNQAEVVKITFPAAGLYAFGLHITVASSNGNWCIDLTQTGCAYNVINSSTADVEFFGIVSDAPITAPLYIRWATGSPTIRFTDFEAFTTAQVPETQTMLLVGFGLIILRLARWTVRRGVSPRV